MFSSLALVSFETAIYLKSKITAQRVERNAKYREKGVCPFKKPPLFSLINLESISLLIIIGFWKPAFFEAPNDAFIGFKIRVLSFSRPLSMFKVTTESLPPPSGTITRLLSFFFEVYLSVCFRSVANYF